MRADGSTFPVELAVTRPDLPGPPLFCGYLRDVTERRRAEQRPAGDGRGAGRAAPGGHRGRRRGRARAALRPHRRGGRTRARRGHRQHPALQRRRHRAGHGRVERRRGGDPGRHDAWSSTATRSPRRSGAPIARHATTASKARPAAWPRRSARRGIKAAVGAPVIFAGDLWGAVIISSDDAPFPPEAEFRVGDFADLAAQAIANAHAREELAASRMRIVEASDAERRRLERNLHDGAQQRLVATSLAVRMAARRVTDDPAAARDARRRRRRAGARARGAARAGARAASRSPHRPRPVRGDRGGRRPCAAARHASMCRSTSACPRRSRPRPTSSSARR